MLLGVGDDSSNHEYRTRRYSEKVVVMLLELRLPGYPTGTCSRSGIVVDARCQLTKLHTHKPISRTHMMIFRLHFLRHSVVSNYTCT